jgi:hypothetical protein
MRALTPYEVYLLIVLLILGAIAFGLLAAIVLRTALPRIERWAGLDD